MAGASRNLRSAQPGRKLHFKPVQVFHMGITHLPERFQRLVRSLSRTAIQHNHGVLIRKKPGGQLFHLICRNIQGALLMSRAVLIQSPDIHQHNRTRGDAFRRHNHGGGSRVTFRIPAFQPNEEGRQPGHHDHVQNHIFHAATSLNRGEVIKRKQRPSHMRRRHLPPTQHRRLRSTGKQCAGYRRNTQKREGTELSLPPPHSTRPENHSPTPHHQSPLPGKRSQKRGFPIPPHPRVSNIPEASSPSPRLPECQWKPHLRAIRS